MNNRILSADEISRILKNHVYKPDLTYALGENFRAVQQPENSGLVFQLERNGKTHSLAAASMVELAEISEILWTRRVGGEAERAARDLLMPDWMKEKPDPLEGTPAGLMPDYLRDVPDDPNLEPDPTGLCPDWARQTKADAARARRIESGTATVDDLLMPDYLRGADDVPARAKTPAEKVTFEMSFGEFTLGEWLAKQEWEKAEKAEKEADGQKEVRITLAEWIEKQKGNAEKISIQE